MSKENATQLISYLGEKLGLPDLALDDKDYCCIFSDDGVVTNIDYYEHDDLFVMYTTIGVISDNSRLEIFELMLKGNFGWKDTAGAMTCVDPTGKLALLMTDLPVAPLDGELFCTAIERFHSLSWAWSDKIHEISETSKGAVETHQQATSAPMILV